MDNKQQFAQLMEEVMEVYDKKPNKGVMRIWWESLKEYDFADVSKAFSIHTMTSKFAPVPASILEHLPDTSGWLSPEEAWNALPKTEYDGGYVNQGLWIAWVPALIH